MILLLALSLARPDSTAASLLFSPWDLALIGMRGFAADQNISGHFAFSLFPFFPVPPWKSFPLLLVPTEKGSHM
jgi:hypothetical protein